VRDEADLLLGRTRQLDPAQTRDLTPTILWQRAFFKVKLGLMHGFLSNQHKPAPVQPLPSPPTSAAMRRQNRYPTRGGNRNVTQSPEHDHNHDHNHDPHSDRNDNSDIDDDDPTRACAGLRYQTVIIFVQRSRLMLFAGDASVGRWVIERQSGHCEGAHPFGALWGTMCGVQHHRNVVFGAFVVRKMELRVDPLPKSAIQKFLLHESFLESSHSE
jgi:hypothetical protein